MSSSPVGAALETEDTTGVSAGTVSFVAAAGTEVELDDELEVWGASEVVELEVAIGIDSLWKMSL